MHECNRIAPRLALPNETLGQFASARIRLWQYVPRIVSRLMATFSEHRSAQGSQHEKEATVASGGSFRTRPRVYRADRFLTRLCHDYISPEQRFFRIKQECRHLSHEIMRELGAQGASDQCWHRRLNPFQSGSISIGVQTIDRRLAAETVRLSWCVSDRGRAEATATR